MYHIIHSNFFNPSDNLLNCVRIQSEGTRLFFDVKFFEGTFGQTIFLDFFGNSFVEDIFII